MKPPLTEDERQRLSAMIAGAERLTSAEFKIILTGSSWLGLGNKARKLFAKHGLDKTPQRNAVMILVDYRSHELLVYGDEDAHVRLGQAFWDSITGAMIDEVKGQGLCVALCTGLHLLGEALAAIYPADAVVPDRISNEVVYEK